MKNYYDLLTSIHAALLLFPAQVTCMYKQSSTFLFFFLRTSGTKLVDYISNIWITMHTGLTLGQTTWDNFGLVSNSCCHLAVFGIDYILVIREKSCILKWDDLPWWLKWWICWPRSACCHPHPPPHCPPLLLSPCPGTVVSWEQDPSPQQQLKPTFSQLFILFLPLLFSLFSGQTFLLQHHPLLLLNLPHKGFIQLLLHLKASFHVSDCLCTEFSKGTIGHTVLWLAIHHMT